MQKQNNSVYLQYGSGNSSAKDWINFDKSPTLYIREHWLLKFIFISLLRRKNNFSKTVRYGDIVKGFPKYNGMCKAIYCSHVLEHLTLEEFRIALKNTYTLLEDGGQFRLILPDLETLCSRYLTELSTGNKLASCDFMRNTYLGLEKRKGGLQDYLGIFYFSNMHFWMWDKYSIEFELNNAGFKNIKTSTFGKGGDPMFNQVEDEIRFKDAIVIDCWK